MESAEKSLNDSAQSPAWRRKAVPVVHRGQVGGEVAGLAGEDERRELGELLQRALERGEVGPVRLLHSRAARATSSGSRRCHQDILAASTRGSTRITICGDRAMTVAVRLIPCTSSMRLITCLEVVVAAGDDPAVQVAGAGRGVGLEHLGDVAQVLDHVLEPALGDLKRGEGQDRVARGRRGSSTGPKPSITPRLDELVEAGLNGASGDAQLARELEDAGAGRRRPGRRSRRASSASMVNLTRS